MSEAWTFSNITFEWLRQSGEAPSLATMQRKPRIVERPLLGTGDADVSRIGYEAYRISGAIYVEATNAAAFESTNGNLGTLTDGTTSWDAVLILEDWARLAPDGSEGYVGQATFIRPRAT